MPSFDGFRDPGEAQEAALELARRLGVSITVGDVLHRAGHADGPDLERFLDPRLVHLTPPDLMADRAVSAERLARAIRAKERICVFGDYDCDGITAAAVLTGAIRALGGEVVPLLATRQEGSYGLSARALVRVLDARPGLLVTCDCGSSDHERLARVRAAGIDALVIDHHLVPDEPLPVMGFLNPHRPDCAFPYKGLASCGLALSLGAAVRKELGVTLDMRAFLDLVAIGTVADVAPLDGDNRILVRAGLGVLGGGARPGLRALGQNAKLDASRGMTAEDIAFKIAPRLNATGRLADPDLSLSLLLERDPATAARLAAEVEEVSTRRRLIQEKMVADALAEIERCGYADAPAIVLGRQGWHPGVVGIVAGRITERFRKPTIVVALEGETGRGSVRGPSGSRLHDALSRCRAALVGFGGHQAAAGVEVRADRLDALRDLWCEAFTDPEGASAQGSPSIPPGVEADVRLDDRDDPVAVVADLDRLEPCGEKNRAPLLLLRDVPITSARDLKGHLKIEVRQKSRAIAGFGFELGAKASSLAGRRADVIGRLRRDSYRGGDAVEIKIERVAPRG
ncbi:MAG: single-stranded-DNA-specific exonuclease RecJ [Byssovorax sp.]